MSGVRAYAAAETDDVVICLVPPTASAPALDAHVHFQAVRVVDSAAAAAAVAVPLAVFFLLSPDHIYCRIAQ